MGGREPDRKPYPACGSVLASVFALVIGLAATGAALAADDGAPGGGFWDNVLEKLDIKPTPAAPAPAFVQRTRPDPASLGYARQAIPHKVSPVPVKTADQIQAKKDALDAAKGRQLQPQAPPAELASGRKAAKAVRPAAVD